MGVYGIKPNILESLCEEIVSINNVLIDKVIGLEKDLAAVENSVASPLSNDFVEGTNSKLKMVKRTMYGRCNRLLLAAKLMYSITTSNG